MQGLSSDCYKVKLDQRAMLHFRDAVTRVRNLVTARKHDPNNLKVLDLFQPEYTRNRHVPLHSALLLARNEAFHTSNNTQSTQRPSELICNWCHWIVPFKTLNPIRPPQHTFFTHITSNIQNEDPSNPQCCVGLTRERNDPL